MFAKLVIAALLLISAPVYAQNSKPAMITQLGSCFPNQVLQQITPPNAVTCTTSMVNSFQQFPGVNTQTGASYTIASSDYGQLVTFNNGSPVAVTLGSAVSNYPFNFFTQNLGAGAVTITPSAGTINGTSSYTVNQGAGAFIVSDHTNWQVFGNVSVGVLIPSTGTSGGVPYFDSTTTSASSGLLTANAPILGGGAGSAPTSMTGTSGSIPYFNSSSTIASDGVLGSHGIVIGGGAGSAPMSITACTTAQLVYGTATAPVCQTPASTTSTPSDPGTTGSASLTMLGLAGAITPLATGRIYVEITGSVSLITTSNIVITCRYGTGAAPTKGAAGTGTIIGTGIKYIGAATAAITPFSCGGIATGLTLSTAYWLDASIQSSAASGTFTNFTVSAYEF